MTPTNIIVLIGILIFVAFLFIFINYRKNKKREFEARIERENYNLLLNSFLSRIKKANAEFRTLISGDKYISNFDSFTYYSSFKPLYAEIPYSSIETLAFESEVKDQAKLFKTNIENLHSLVTQANKSFIESELKRYKNFFDNIEGKSLDLQQRKAIITDEDNNIVVSGAGSGKTTTIAGKVKYLVEKCGIQPKEILLIAFTRKASEEMRNRIKEKMNIEVSVKTFNKLGLDIIADVKNERPSIFDKSNKETIEIFASFIEHAKKDSKYFSNLVQFFIYWLKPYKEEKDFDTEGERTNYLIDQKYEGLKLTGHETSSYKFMPNNHGFQLVKREIAGLSVTYREKLKSQEEVLIANFLFINSVEYCYEERYQYKTSSKTFGQYKPDFYLPEYDIYIEHFAIDKNGNVPEWFRGDEFQTAKEKYNAGIDWKREEHLRNNTTLIETYSWEKREGVLLINLEHKLKQHGVILKPKSNHEIWAYLKENTPAEIDNFTTLVFTFLVLLKSNNLSIKELKALAKEKDDERALLFLDLFSPIYNSYGEYLKESGEIDFSDMINLATEEIKANKFASPYKYIIIDEFQDISLSRYQLIKSLLDNRPETKLFCVGDDWQSIYRFTGSDIGIFTGFEEYFKSTPLFGFERKASKSFIENTYRFDNQLIELSSNFILRNPHQIRKTLKSKIHSDKKPFTILNYDYNNSIINPLHEAFELIASELNDATATVKLLGRYSHDIDEIKKSKLIYKYNHNTKETTISHPSYQNIEIEFHTVHTAKGLEADYIVILNGNAGKYGFPTEISDDPLLNFLLSKSDQFPNGEERRLFYVALTRAKKHVYILSNSENRSKFIDEIEIDEKISNKRCEWCDNGILIERIGPFGYFYACSSSHYCNFTRKIESSDFIEKADKLQNEKEFTKAIDYYTKALELDNQNYQTFYNRGRCYEENGNKQEALNDYTKAISLNASHFNSFYWRASVNYDLNNYQVAANDWLEARKLNPDNNSTLYWIAKSQFNLSQYLNALSNINAYISLKQDDKEAYIIRGECYAKTNKFADAYTDWQKAKSLGYNNVEFYLKRYNVNELSQNVANEIKVESHNKEVLIKAIKEAINNNQNIQFNYQKSTTFSTGELSKRTLKPTEFERIGISESLCIKGYCYMRKDERVFAIDRISNLVINPSKIEFWEE